MTHRRVQAVVAVGLILFVTASPSPAAEDGSPEAVVRAAIDALNQAKPREFARAMHPEALKQFRDVLMSLVDAASKAGQGGQILALFPSVKDVEGLKKLDDQAFFADYLGAVTARDPSMKENLATAKVDILGHVDEGKDLAHVVYRIRIKLDGEYVDGGVVAASLRREKSRWSMLLLGDMEAMTFMIKQRTSGKITPPDKKGTKVEYLGKIPEGREMAHLVYRSMTPAGESMLRKVNVLTLKAADPECDEIQSAKSEVITELIRKKITQ